MEQAETQRLRDFLFEVKQSQSGCEDLVAGGGLPRGSAERIELLLFELAAAVLLLDE